MHPRDVEKETSGNVWVRSEITVIQHSVEENRKDVNQKEKPLRNGRRK